MHGIWARRKEHNQEFIVGGDPTIPDDAIILLLDADTRVPERCIVQVCARTV
jgi:hypothetical protein